ncbi:zinc finger protein 678 isoform X2 [Cephus cinctus]|uniref:Zinc finger protein 678 isoform X2 n=1 Tax=Cephus cinctus TaxID=211228 RepID=A0AAJ7VZH6_CEPCN|nr:zinc finger protein 678 isoform X2 [Cephus cinctus]
MVNRRCSAKTCFNESISRPDLKFFLFPKAEHDARIWAKACDRPELMNKSLDILRRYVLCAEHFEDRWFINPPHNTAFIKTALPIPTIFRNNIKEILVHQRKNLSVSNGDAAATIDTTEQTETDNMTMTQNWRFNTEAEFNSQSGDNSNEEQRNADLVINASEVNKEDNTYNFCRLCACLIPASLLSSIYDTHMNLKINKILPNEAHLFKHDGLAEEACKSCIDKLTVCNDTIQQFINANQKLRELKKNRVEENINQSLSSESTCRTENDTAHPEENLQFNSSQCFDVNLNHKSDTTIVDIKEEDSVDVENELNNTEIYFQKTKTTSMNSQKSSLSKIKCPETTVFKCMICNEEFLNRNSVVEHSIAIHAIKGKKHEVKYTVTKKKIEKRRQLKKYHCTSCPLEFTNCQTYQAHMKWHPSRNNTYEYCDRYFILQSRLESHKRLHFSQKPYQCNICNESFVFINSLKRHKKSHMGDMSLHKCKRCNKMFPTIALMQRHTKAHYEKRVLCNLCGKLLSSPQNVQYHLTTHSEERPFSCTICSKSFKTTSKLNCHNKKHRVDHRFECNLCDKKFRMKSLLKQHMNTHLGERRYFCEMYGARFNRYGNLTKHRKRHAVSSALESSYTCDICHKNLKTAFAYKYHMVKHSEERQPYSCDICDKPFRQIAQLRVHNRLHTGERPYACTECGQRFRTKATMDQHYITLHTDNYPHECPYCDKRFKRLHSLNCHKKTHTGERSYVCRICYHAFAQKGDMLKHMKIHSQRGLDSHFQRAHNQSSNSDFLEESTTDTEDSEWMTEVDCSEEDITNDYLMTDDELRTKYN